MAILDHTIAAHLQSWIWQDFPQHYGLLLFPSFKAKINAIDTCTSRFETNNLPPLQYRMHYNGSLVLTLHWNN